MPGEPVTPREGVLFQELPEQAMLLDTDTDRCYQLNAVGAQVWLGLQQGLTQAGIAAEVAREFTIPVERAEADVEAFLQRLQAAGLVRVGEREAEGLEAT